MTYLLAFIAAISATAILFVKEVFHAALALIVCLLSIAGIFLATNAEFLAVVQIIVYAGGVLLLIVFGIMLTKPAPSTSYNNIVITSIVGLVLLAIFVYAINGFSLSNPAEQLSPEDIGVKLVTRYAVEFEVAGVLLLVSLIAAIVAATNLKKT